MDFAVIHIRNFVCIYINFVYLFLSVLGLHFFAWTFSSCSKQGLLCGVWASQCSGFSCGAQALGMHGLESRRSTWVAAYRPSSTGSVVMAHGFGCSLVCAIFPDQEIKSSSHALAGGFLSITPPRKFL